MTAPFKPRVFDPFEHTWRTIGRVDPGQRTIEEAAPAQIALRADRTAMLRYLINEIRLGHQPITTLYAALLGKELCYADPALMRKFGEQLAALIPEPQQ
jgi:hypothetical protein